MSATTAADTTPAISARLIEVTPQLATKWLQKNTRNRAIDMRRVDTYAQDMRRGEWALNGEAIKLARDGQVLDGQHRLMAVIDADITIKTLVIAGLEPVAQETMDQGRARSFADVLKLRGEKQYCVLAAATKIVCVYERTGLPYGPQPSVPQLSRTLEHNPELRDSVEFAVRNQRVWLGVSPAAGMHYLLSSADPEAATDFFTRLLTGVGLTADSPVYALRERLTAEHGNPDGGLAPKVVLAFVVKAWNAYQGGDAIQRLIWKPGGPHPEPFPRIRGLHATTGDVAGLEVDAA